MELKYDMEKPLIPQYLEAVAKGLKYEYYTWLLEKGETIPSETDKRLIRKILKKFPQYNKSKECYYNAQIIAVLSKRSSLKLKYYEGFYITDKKLLLPLEHGFLVHKGKVIDPTAYGKFEVREYFGIKINSLEVGKQMLKDGVVEPLLPRIYHKEMKKNVDYI